MSHAIHQWDPHTVFFVAMVCMILSMLCWFVAWAIGMYFVGVVFVVVGTIQLFSLMALT